MGKEEDRKARWTKDTIILMAGWIGFAASRNYDKDTPFELISMGEGGGRSSGIMSGRSRVSGGSPLIVVHHKVGVSNRDKHSCS